MTSKASIPETSHTSHPDPSCPFCSIAAAFQPIAPSTPNSADWNPEKLSPSTYVILSSPDVIAFLDIAPLTRGHVLVAPRRHRVRVGDLCEVEGAEIGRLLPLLARSVLRAVFPDTDPSEADYNVVQNNGPRAAQVVPHVHFHIIPRPDTAHSSSAYNSPVANSTPASHSRFASSYTMFGRGLRNELDEDDALSLSIAMRNNVQSEIERVRQEEGVDLERLLWGGHHGDGRKGGKL